MSGCSGLALAVCLPPAALFPHNDGLSCHSTTYYAVYTIFLFSKVFVERFARCLSVGQKFTAGSREIVHAFFLQGYSRVLCDSTSRPTPLLLANISYYRCAFGTFTPAFPRMPGAPKN
jgi:hypothetical protein